MKRSAIVLVAATLVCGVVGAQDQPGPSYEHLKFLEPLVGNWNVVVNEGDKVTSRGQEASVWMLDKNFMRQYGWGQIEGQPLRYHFYTGWNAKTNEVFQWACGATDGSYAMGERIGKYEPDQRVWTSREVITVSDGSTHSGTVALKFGDKNHYTMEFTDRQADGQSVPGQKSAYVRDTAITEPEFDNTPGPGFAHLKFFDFSVGKWKLEGDLPLVGKYVGEEVNKWVYDKNFMHTIGQGTLADGTRINYELLSGWEPVKKVVVMWIIGSDGAHSRREGTYDPNTKTLTSRETGMDAHGVESSATIQEQYMDNDHFLLKITNHVHGKENVPDAEVTVTRIDE